MGFVTYLPQTVAEKLAIENRSLRAEIELAVTKIARRDNQAAASAHRRSTNKGKEDLAPWRQRALPSDSVEGGGGPAVNNIAPRNPLNAEVHRVCVCCKLDGDVVLEVTTVTSQRFDDVSIVTSISIFPS